MSTWTSLEQKLMMWIDGHQNELIERTQEILQIKSVKGDPAPGAPFGVGPYEALNYALNLAGTYGLTTKNLDGYAGHAEWIPKGVESDAEIVGVLAHVDVVPEGKGWKHEPYGAEVDGGRLYARGAIDDKGPAMAGLYAILALKECGMIGTRRVRLILGADEESGFSCVEHYFAHEEMPALGFTPDADFPLIFAEKGISNVYVTAPAKLTQGAIKLVNVSGGLRPNMVPDAAVATVVVDSGSIIAAIARVNAAVGVTAVAAADGSSIEISAAGVSAHGSTPDLGLNAVHVLCDALLLLDFSDQDQTWIAMIRDFAKDNTGSILGIAGEDPVSGSLTSNLGTISFADGLCDIVFNIRYPVSWTEAQVLNKMNAVIGPNGFAVTKTENHAPLHIAADDPLVRSLLDVYREDTGDMSPPIAIGGGTYARVMSKGVAFGPEFPGGKGGAHEHDESWGVDELIRATKIYAKAILRLINA